MRSISALCALLVFGAAVCSGARPSIVLKNAATPGMLPFPVEGLGTGGYGLEKSLTYPECWIEKIGCGPRAANATATWLKLGGRRVDNADSYFNQASIGDGIRQSGIPRSSIFITSKVGPSNPLGYNDTLAQWETIKQQMRVDYVDLLLIHWPTYNGLPVSSDPLCQPNTPTYDAKACRLSTWKAMVVLFKQGAAKAIGVSNYNETHIQEIIDAGMPLPAVNQCPFNPYRGSSQLELVKFCQQNNIVFNGYSPLGIPDLAVDVPATSSALLHKYPPPMSPTLLVDPTIVKIAAAHQRTPAEIIQAWAWSQGVPTNARCANPTHMQQNMNYFDITLTAAEIAEITALPQDYCSIDNWYECAPAPNAN